MNGNRLLLLRWLESQGKKDVTLMKFLDAGFSRAQLYSAVDAGLVAWDTTFRASMIMRPRQFADAQLTDTCVYLTEAGRAALKSVAEQETEKP